jgi:hypothetical protein
MFGRLGATKAATPETRDGRAPIGRSFFAISGLKFVREEFKTGLARHGSRAGIETEEVRSLHCRSHRRVQEEQGWRRRGPGQGVPSDGKAKRVIPIDFCSLEYLLREVPRPEALAGFGGALAIGLFGFLELKQKILGLQLVQGRDWERRFTPAQNGLGGRAAIGIDEQGEQEPGIKIRNHEILSKADPQAPSSNFPFPAKKGNQAFSGGAGGSL